METRPINSLAEVEAMRKQLKISMAVTRKEFFRSAGDTAALGRKALFQKVLLPAGLAGLGIAAIKKILPDHEDLHAAEEMVPTDGNPITQQWWFKLLMAGLPLLQQYIFNYFESEESE